MNIKTVTIIGANGTMGANISGIFASFGGANVYMVARDMKKAEEAKQKAAQSVKAGSIVSRLFAADFSQLEDCISKSDLIFETVSEDIEIKKKIARAVAIKMKPNAISCSGTSGLSITQLAEEYPLNLRGRFFGVHMFNPPYSLNLCELIQTKYTEETLLKDLENYLCKVLYRTVVRVKDCPAFLGNRIGFQFINEVLQYAERYKYSGGIDYMDAILGCFSGRSMSPLVTLDFVGLDIHKAIVDHLYLCTNDYARDTFLLPKIIQQLIDEGKLGKKVKCGLYKTITNESGIKNRMVYDICTNEYRDKVEYQFPFAVKMKESFKVGDYKDAFNELITNRSIEAELCLEFLLKYILYSLVATNLVGYDIHAADHVMAMGFNWCPPLAIADAINTVTDIKKLLRERISKETQEKFDFEKIINSIVPSTYDYRLFFKSKS